MKPVLIIENSSTGLKMDENAKSTERKYSLNGPFTEFDVVNRNERIYTAQEFLPHLNEMLERKKWGVIYGEMDHPDVFDVSLKYCSHIIENAWYNQDENRVDGQIRLLSTTWGKEAKAIVDDGLPLFVSSRAAGVTEGNGHVKLKKLFTYDIVADPGFSAAKMTLMNESFGLTNESHTKIYKTSKKDLGRLNEKYNRNIDPRVFDLTDESKTNQLFEMNKNDLVTKKQMTEYSNYLTQEIKNLRKEITNKVTQTKNGNIAPEEINKLAESLEAFEATQAKMIEYLDYLAEKVSISVSESKANSEKTEKLVEYTNYLAENLDKSIDYSNYIAENLDKSIDYSNYLAENLDKNIDYSNYLAENLDKSIDYSNYLAENLDNSIDYSNYLAENLDKSIDYTNYLAENLDNNISYSEYLAENLETNIKYAEYLAENLDANIGYTEYLAENLDANINYAEYIAENLDSAIDYSEYVAECTDKTMGYANMISEKLNNSKGSLNESFQTAEDYLISESKKEQKFKKLNESKYNTTTTKKVVSKNEDSKKTQVNETKKTDKKPVGKLSDQIDTLIAEAKKREASKVEKPSFYAFLTPSDIKTFESLASADKEKVIIAVNESVGYYSRNDVLSIMSKALAKEEPTPEQIVIASIPKDVLPIWESQSKETKKSVLAQARLHNVSTPDLVEHFWRTRTLQQPLTEGKKTIDMNPIESYEKLSDEQIDGFLNRFNG